jgi:hypothetical protein
MHEGKSMGLRLPRRARLATTAVALVSALALAAPTVAGAYCKAPTPVRSYTISQNTSMIVDVGAGSASADGAVSWSDVSWGDGLVVE